MSKGVQPMTDPHTESPKGNDKELEDEIEDIFITIDNYGTAIEARTDIEALITKEKNKLLQSLIEEAVTYDIAGHDIGIGSRQIDYEVIAVPVDSIKRRIEE
jgi:hypothetical protein